MRWARTWSAPPWRWLRTSRADTRGSGADFLESLTVATAALREVETLLLAATRVCLLSGDQIQTAMGLGDEVGRMLTALRRSLGAPHLQPGRLRSGHRVGRWSERPVRRLVDSRPRSP